MRQASNRKFSKSEKGLAKRKRQYNAVKQLQITFRLSVSNKDGTCVLCEHHRPGQPALPATQCDHLIPTLKSKDISQCSTPTQLINEVRKNTVNGVVMIRGVCAHCHQLVTNTQRGIDRVNYKPSKYRELVNQYKRNIGKCQDHNCQLPEVLCIAGSESLFHLDHKHPKHCVCEICTENPTLRKVADIARLAGSNSMKKLLKELTEEKVQLLHGVCHFILAIEQFKRGELLGLSQTIKEIYEEEINEENNDNNDSDNVDSDNNDDGENHDDDNFEPSVNDSSSSSLTATAAQ